MLYQRSRNFVKPKNQHQYYRTLKERGLTLDVESNYFILQHLRGVHPPYNIDENGKSLQNATLEQSAKGYFLMVEEYLRQMKDLGVYDNSTIIITADHGSGRDTQIIYFIKEAGKRQDAMQISTAPISNKDLIPTILASIGEDYSSFGKSIYDFGENEMRERTVLVRAKNDQYPLVPKHNSTALGSSNVYNAFTYTGNSKDLLDVMDKGPTEIIPMTDAFF